MKSTTYEFPLLVITSATERHQDLPEGHLQAPESFKFPFTIDIGSNTKRNTYTEIQSRLHCTVDDERLLWPYTTVLVWRKLPKAIYINKTLVTRYKAPKITEYLDLSTGEIIEASNLRNDPRVPPQLHVGEIQLLRQALIDSLRKEVREFALFILHFRNNRRGISPEIGTLVEWYALIFKKRPSNVRRYVKALQGASFLAGESLLSPLFQRTGKTVTSKDHLGEDAAARSTLLKIRIKATSRLDLSPVNHLAGK